jgi:hypothetical protein
MSWPKYLDGAAGRDAFRRERLRLRAGRSLAEAFERDRWQPEHFAIFADPTERLALIEATRGFGKTTEAGQLGVERIVLREEHDDRCNRSTFSIPTPRARVRVG